MIQDGYNMEFQRGADAVNTLLEVAAYLDNQDRKLRRNEKHTEHQRVLSDAFASIRENGAESKRREIISGSKAATELDNQWPPRGVVRTGSSAVGEGSERREETQSPILP
jgi:hypothetical protein